ncbi:unnamed protein product [Diamesa hyperborea]
MDTDMKNNEPAIAIKVVDYDKEKNSSGSREFEIDFIDSENEKKFDKLLSEDKIKSPFKRRLSNEKQGESVSRTTPEKSIKKKSRLDEKDDDDEESIDPKESRFRCESSSSSSACSSIVRKQETETDKSVLERRQKQIDYGKNTVGYDTYISQVNKCNRTKDHPKTPPKNVKYSRRAWEGLVRSWRKKLHFYDPDSVDNDINDDTN